MPQSSPVKRKQMVSGLVNCFKQKRESCCSAGQASCTSLSVMKTCALCSGRWKQKHTKRPGCVSTARWVWVTGPAMALAPTRSWPNVVRPSRCCNTWATVVPCRSRVNPRSRPPQRRQTRHPWQIQGTRKWRFLTRRATRQVGGGTVSSRLSLSSSLCSSFCHLF